MAENAVERFGANLRAERERRNLSQERLAFRARLHPTQVSLLERGRREPRLTTLLKLARALDVPLSALLRDLE